MTYDLLKRLRDPEFPPKPAGNMALRLSAADEIERLERQYADLKNISDNGAARLEKEMLENERLRDALKRIIKRESEFHCGPDGCFAGYAVSYARKALEGTDASS